MHAPKCSLFPFTGTLIDKFGDYKYMFLAAGTVMVSAGTFLLVMNYYNYQMLAKEAMQKPEEAGRIEAGEGNATRA